VEAVQVRAADAVEAVAWTFVGGLGTGAVGVANAVAAGPAPVVFTATKLNVYGVPFVRPVTVVLSCAAGIEIGTAPPGEYVNS
jgi:hypothetical protein